MFHVKHSNLYNDGKRSPLLEKGNVLKFSINQSELQNALSVVLKGIATRSTLPIPSGIYLDAHDDTYASSDDLSRPSSTRFRRSSRRRARPGSRQAVLRDREEPARRSRARGSRGRLGVITCDTASFSIKTLDAEDFPDSSTWTCSRNPPSPLHAVHFHGDMARVVSKDESRAILTGRVDHARGHHAQDGGHRLVSPLPSPKPSFPNPAEEFQAVIAGSFLQEISRCRARRTTPLALAENQIVVTYHDNALHSSTAARKATSRNYRQLLPDSHATRASMDVGHLVAGVKRTSLLGQTSLPVRFDDQYGVADRAAVRRVAQDGLYQETLSCARAKARTRSLSTTPTC